MRGICAVVVLLLSVFASVAADASAGSDASGGASAPAPPDLDAAECIDGRRGACGEGQLLVLRGEGLDGVDRVLFRGRRGRADDRRARPTTRRPDLLRVRVPRGTRSGPLSVRGPMGASPRPLRLRIVDPPPEVARDRERLFLGGTPSEFVYEFPAGAAGRVELVRAGTDEVVRSWPAVAGGGTVAWDGTVDGRTGRLGLYLFRVVAAPGGPGVAAQAREVRLLDHIFPIRGPHDLGRSATNAFGGGRGHQGQDMFARCGTRLVAARGGVVKRAGYHAAAGNHVVIEREDGQAYAYMHLRRPALVREGQTVLTGQRIGAVGDSGRASGCHLHFELWSAPGWYEGGRPFDPLPQLRRWDRTS